MVGDIIADSRATSPGIRREDYRKRDLLDQVARLIEIFGIDGAADIVGCPLRPLGDGGE